MIERTYVTGADGQPVDIYARFGVFVCEGGYKDLVAWPPLKKVQVNDWPEEDGSDPDLSDPRLDSRTFNINFGCNDADGVNAFIGLLSEKSYHTFDFREIGLTRTLRLASQPNLRAVRNLSSFAFQFTDDLYELRESGEIAPPDPQPVPVVASQGFFMDGLDLATEYGLTVVEGTMDSLEKAPGVKQNLTINVQNEYGAWYDDMYVFFQEQKATLKLFLRTPDKKSFWYCYDRFLAALTAKHERQLHLRQDTEEVYFCYYDSASVSRFVPTPDGGIWCEFSVNLNFTSYRPGQVMSLLSSEDGFLIVTEESNEEKDYSVFVEAKPAI